MSAMRILGPRRIIKCAENSACCKCQWQKSCSWECYTLSEWVWCVQVCVSACVRVCACVCECIREGECVRVWVHTWGCVWVHVCARVWEREMHRQGEIFGFILFWHIALGSYFSEKRASVKTFLFLFCSVTRMREKEEEGDSLSKPLFVLFQRIPPFCSVLSRWAASKIPPPPLRRIAVRSHWW